ncbi:ribonuclease H-like YkuK family protein [Peptococcaceae bacterium]|nr:ribonuclease H-like YkuK family protein [Peptococcaceae bacterium]
MKFISPTYGKMSFEQMMANIMKYITGLPHLSYKIIVGSDSQVKTETCFITAVIIHRLGKGARYFYHKRQERKMKSLRQKIFYETSLSLEVGGMITRYLSETGHDDLKIEIHIDVGKHGETKKLIKEVVGMVRGSGFDAKIKPDAFGAASVADKHSK